MSRSTTGLSRAEWRRASETIEKMIFVAIAADKLTKSRDADAPGRFADLIRSLGKSLRIATAAIAKYEDMLVPVGAETMVGGETKASAHEAAVTLAQRYYFDVCQIVDPAIFALKHRFETAKIPAAWSKIVDAYKPKELWPEFRIGDLLYTSSIDAGNGWVSQLAVAVQKERHIVLAALPAEDCNEDNDEGGELPPGAGRPAKRDEAVADYLEWAPKNGATKADPKYFEFYKDHRKRFPGLTVAKLRAAVNRRTQNKHQRTKSRTKSKKLK